MFRVTPVTTADVIDLNSRTKSRKKFGKKRKIIRLKRWEWHQWVSVRCSDSHLWPPNLQHLNHSHCTVFHCTVLFFTENFSTNHMILHCTVLHCLYWKLLNKHTVQHCTALYFLHWKYLNHSQCTVLHYSAQYVLQFCRKTSLLLTQHCTLFLAA